MIPLKYATIMSGLVVRWRFAPKHGDVRSDAEINASRDGVSICGSWPIMGNETLERVIATLEVARTISMRISAGDELPEIPSARMFEKPKPLETPGACEKFLDNDSEIYR